MKTTNKSLLLLIIMVTSARLTFAQSTTSTNNFSSSTTRFLGWGTTSGDLPFRTNNITRMTLKNNTGFLGIGITAPQQMLHLHDGLNGTYTQYTNTATGTTNGFLTGIASDGTADLLQRFAKPIRFYTGRVQFIQNENQA